MGEQLLCLLAGVCYESHKNGNFLQVFVMKVTRMATLERPSWCRFDLCLDKWMVWSRYLGKWM